MQQNHCFYRSETASKVSHDAFKTSPDASNGLAKHLKRVLGRSRTALGCPKTDSNTLTRGVFMIFERKHDC